MPIIMELEIEHDDTLQSVGKCSASITFQGNGKPRTSLTFGRQGIIEAICAAMQPIMVIAPNSTQAEVDEHYKKYP